MPIAIYVASKFTEIWILNTARSHKNKVNYWSHFKVIRIGGQSREDNKRC